MKIIDCTGLTCPIPVVNVKKGLEQMDWHISKIIIDNEISKENVSKFLRSKGFEFSITSHGNIYNILVINNFTNKVSTEDLYEKVNSNTIIKEGLIIIISSDQFGNGDAQLGAILMKSYLFSLTEIEDKPEILIFLNSGVKLTCEGSDVISSLKALEINGSEILSCGTCLDYYKLKDKLLVGSITNMYTIVDKMYSSKNIVKI